jgi:tetratricopeptide (TPR) repeat protein
MIEIDMGQDDAAEAHTRAAEQLLANALPLVSFVFSRGYISMQRDEWQQAYEYFDRMRKRIAETESVFFRFFIDPLAAQAALGLGRPEDAIDTVTDALRLARAVGTRHHEGVVRRVQAQALASLQRWEEAMDAFNDAAVILEANGSRLELGQAIFHRGLTYLARGDSDMARADLTRASAIFESSGARRDRERAIQALAAVSQ